MRRWLRTAADGSGIAQLVRGRRRGGRSPRDRFLGHPPIRDLLSLELDRADFALAGSGPLFARGWIDDPGDIDVLARGLAWQTAAALGDVWVKESTGVRRVSLFDGTVDVFDGWFPYRWPVACLIDEADVIHGVRCIPLEVVVATKKMLGRPRDLRHLRVVNQRLG